MEESRKICFSPIYTVANEWPVNVHEALAILQNSGHNHKDVRGLTFVAGIFGYYLFTTITQNQKEAVFWALPQIITSLKYLPDNQPSHINRVIDLSSQCYRHFGGIASVRPDVQYLRRASLTRLIPACLVSVLDLHSLPQHHKQKDVS